MPERAVPAFHDAVGRRVRDVVQGSIGTVVAFRGWGGRDRRFPCYEVAWEPPTPHQDTAWCPIPSRFFEWEDA